MSESSGSLLNKTAVASFTTFSYLPTGPVDFHWAGVPRQYHGARGFLVVALLWGVGDRNGKNASWFGLVLREFCL